MLLNPFSLSSVSVTESTSIELESTERIVGVRSEERDLMGSLEIEVLGKIRRGGKVKIGFFEMGFEGMVGFEDGDEEMKRLSDCAIVGLYREGEN